MHTQGMTAGKLPDLSPQQVVRLQDALLANADRLLTSALTIFDLGHISLARSLAILGIEESGKAIAIHERRAAMGYEEEGEPFRCDWLDQLWASHQKKLEIVYRFLVEEPYWFDVNPPDPEQNEKALGSIKSWARRNDRSKQRGFYVDLAKSGEVLAPPDVGDEDALREAIERVHQIGWQLRLGEHIEGSRQDEQHEGLPPVSDEQAQLLGIGDRDQQTRSELSDELLRSLREGVPGRPLRNAAYRFNPPDADRSPFRNLGKPGYEAQTRELLRLAGELGDNPD